MNNLLFDTCAVIWTARDEPLSEMAEDAVNTSHPQGRRLYISPFSAWELGILVSKGRLRLSLPPSDWFEHYLRNGQCHLADLSPQILASASFLPGKPPVDRADQILISTARAMDLTMITRNRAIIDYGQEGWVRILAC